MIDSIRQTRFNSGRAQTDTLVTLAEHEPREANDALETTGATPARDRVTEIGIVEVDKNGTVALPLKNLSRFSAEEVALITRQADAPRNNLDTL
jgi:hypothetical protein